jgi:hypothetical protein
LADEPKIAEESSKAAGLYKLLGEGEVSHPTFDLAVLHAGVAGVFSMATFSAPPQVDLMKLLKSRGPANVMSVERERFSGFYTTAPNGLESSAQVVHKRATNAIVLLTLSCPTVNVEKTPGDVYRMTRSRLTKEMRDIIFTFGLANGNEKESGYPISAIGSAEGLDSLPCFK